MADENKNENDISIFEKNSNFNPEMIYKNPGLNDILLKDHPDLKANQVEASDYIQYLTPSIDTLEGLKVFLLDVLQEQVGSYVHSKHMALYDDQNPIYIEYVTLISEIKEIGHAAVSKESYKKGRELYARVMELVKDVSELKKNDDDKRGTRK